jgi:hypothetical protein
MKLFKGLTELHEARDDMADYMDHKQDRNEDPEITEEFERLAERVDEAYRNINPVVAVFLR